MCGLEILRIDLCWGKGRFVGAAAGIDGQAIIDFNTSFSGVKSYDKTTDCSSTWIQNTRASNEMERVRCEIGGRPGTVALLPY